MSSEKFPVYPEPLDEEDPLGVDDAEQDFWQSVELSQLRGEQDEVKAEIEDLKERADLDDQISITDDRKQDTKLRKQYADKVFLLVLIWVLGAGAVIFCQGFQYRGFWLPETSFGLIIGGMSAAVVGLLVTVITYLFPKRDR